MTEPEADPSSPSTKHGEIMESAILENLIGAAKTSRNSVDDRAVFHEATLDDDPRKPDAVARPSAKISSPSSATRLDRFMTEDDRDAAPSEERIPSPRPGSFR
jgi:hypothetical protein